MFGTNRLDEVSGNFYNSMLVINNNFDIISSYNKRKLYMAKLQNMEKNMKHVQEQSTWTQEELKKARDQARP